MSSTTHLVPTTTSNTPGASSMRSPLAADTTSWNACADAASGKFASFFCRTELSRNDYFDAVAVGRRFFEIAGDSCRELASWDDVRAAVARGEVWEG